MNISHDAQAGVGVAHVNHHGVGTGVVTLGWMALLGRSVDFGWTIAGCQQERTAEYSAESDQEHIMAYGRRWRGDDGWAVRHVLKMRLRWAEGLVGNWGGRRSGGGSDASGILPGARV